METFVLIFSVIFGLILIIFNALTWFKLKKIEARDKATLEEGKKLDWENVLPVVTRIDRDVKDLYDISGQLNRVSKKGVCKMGICKFNALGEKSGNQSFALALLNYKDTGIIVSYLKTANDSRMFIRNIKEGKNDQDTQLLDEEIKALERAKQVVF